MQGVIVFAVLVAGALARPQKDDTTTLTPLTSTSIPVTTTVPVGFSTLPAMSANEPQNTSLPPYPTAPPALESNTSTFPSNNSQTSLFETATTNLPETTTFPQTTASQPLPEQQPLQMRTFVSGFAAATGNDGKIYFVKNNNGKIERGVLRGRFPLFDMNQAVNRYFDYSPFASPIQRPDFDIDAAIRNAVNDYLENLRI